MRLIALMLAAFSALALSGSVGARPTTTNSPQLVTIRVTVTDRGITIKPRNAARGSTAIFLLSNHTSKPHSFVIGDLKVNSGMIGFAADLPALGQHRMVMFLDYRGPLRYYSTTTKKASYRGVFTIT